MLLAGIVCVGFAGLDEYHQSFVDARTPAVKDVGIDSIGRLSEYFLFRHSAGLY